MNTLYVIRHAIAQPRGPEVAEADRALTDKGLARLREALAGMKALGVAPERVLHSPWLRAAQTAERVAKVLGGSLDVTETLLHSPAAPLLAAMGEGAVAVVGHEPWLGELMAWLVTGEAERGGQFPLKKAGLAWLEGPFKPGGMTLRALLPAKALRLAGA